MNMNLFSVIIVFPLYLFTNQFLYKEISNIVENHYCVDVQWKILDDDFNYCEVERKNDNGEFVTVGKVFTQEKQTRYSLVDYISFQNYSYRIKAIKNNTEYSYFLANIEKKKVSLTKTTWEKIKTMFR